MSFSVYQQLKPKADYRYKLLQLPPELLEQLKQSDDHQVSIKAAGEDTNHLVLCTNDETWKIRQMNHSNSVLLMGNSENKEASISTENDSLVGFSKLGYEYELTKDKGLIDVDKVPMYDGVKKMSNSCTIDELIDSSLISKKQFYNAWYELGGSEIEGKAVILEPQFLAKGLYLLLQIFLANQIDYKGVIAFKDVLGLVSSQDPKYTPEITWTIMNKYGDSVGDQKFKLNHKKISISFGIDTLKSTTSKMLLSITDFLLAWKSSFPEFYTVPIDMNYLKGHYYKPSLDQIQYLDGSSLSDRDLYTRINELFKIQKEWDSDDFFPFIQDFIPKGKKPESIILKYAKRRRVGKKFVVSPR